MSTAAPGYTIDNPGLATSPVTAQELAELKASVLWTEADQEALRHAAEILVPRTEAILDTWYGFVGANPHLVATFAGPTGQPDAAYLAAVRARFGLWIRDLCTRDFDASWLAYQEEIALRHHTAKKNRTDGIDSPSTHVPLRHLIGLIVPITVTIRGFLAEGEADAGRVDAMYHAWFKAVTLSVLLWARPYTPELW